MTEFRASVVAARELEHFNAFVLVLAELPDGKGHRLEIQKALVVDDQDRKLGHDTYCLSVESGATHYGGIEHSVLTANRFEFVLDEAAAGVFGGKIVVHFPPEDFSIIEAALFRLLGTST